MKNKLLLGTIILFFLALVPSSYSSLNLTNSTMMTVNVVEVVPFNITNVSISSLTDTSVHVLWITNREGNSTVIYGTTLALTSKVFSTDFVKNHNIALTSLTALTKYYFNVTSCDVFGNCNTSGIYTFNTTATPPSPGGPGGGGGGGSAAPEPLECKEMWYCDLFSPCSEDGTRTRTCEDLSACGTTEFKPATQETCTYKPEEVKPVIEVPKVEVPKLPVKPIVTAIGSAFTSVVDFINNTPTKVKLLAIAAALMVITVAIFFTGFRKPSHLYRLSKDIDTINNRLEELNENIEEDFRKLIRR